MKTFKPTDEIVINNPKTKKVFLAGTIDMGNSEDWQLEITKQFENNWDVILFNPRRDEWNPNWKQEQKEDRFNQQVNWELSMLDDSDIIFMYLESTSKSPISLMELGLYANTGKLIVCCPDGFYRKGNVEIVCTRYNIPLFNNLSDAIGSLKTKLRTLDPFCYWESNSGKIS